MISITIDGEELEWDPENHRIHIRSSILESQLHAGLVERTPFASVSVQTNRAQLEAGIAVAMLLGRETIFGVFVEPPARLFHILPTELPDKPGSAIRDYQAAAAEWAIKGHTERSSEARDAVVRELQRVGLDMLRPVWPTSPTPEAFADMLTNLAEMHDGVSRLSHMLADTFRTIAPDDIGDEEWLEDDREAQAAEGHPKLNDEWSTPWRLPSWVIPQGIGGATRALKLLADSVWRHIVFPRLVGRFPTSTALFNVAAGMVTPGKDRWQVSAVHPAVLSKIERSGALSSVEAHALFRLFPDLARQAANAEGRTIEVHPGVTATMTSAHRTEVQIVGGWQSLSTLLGWKGGTPRKRLRAAAHAFAGLPLQWHPHETAGDVKGTTTLIADLIEHGSVISFILPKLWWPGFARVLSKRKDYPREARRLVPIPPTLPPTTHVRLGDAPARLETLALTWLRDHTGQLEERGAPVPWERLADTIKLSSSDKRSRRRAVLDNLLALWIDEGRWHRDGDLWRPSYGWDAPGGLLEAKRQSEGGTSVQRTSDERSARKWS